MSAVRLAIHDRKVNHLSLQDMVGVEPTALDALSIRLALDEVRGLPQFELGRHVALICIPGGKS